MKNCLLTRFNGVVSDEMLPEFGYQCVYLHSDSPVDDEFVLIAPASGHFKILGNGYFIGTNNENLGKQTDSRVAKIHIDGDVILEVPNGAWPNPISDLRMNLSDNANLEVSSKALKCMFGNTVHSLITYLYINNLTGNLAELFPKSINTFALNVKTQEGAANFYGSLDELTFEDPGTIYPRSILLNNCKNISGNLNNFLNRMASVADLEGSNLSGKVQLINCPNITYNGERIGSSWRYNIIYKTNGTWELGSPL